MVSGWFQDCFKMFLGCLFDLRLDDLIEMRGRLCKTADGGVEVEYESSVPVIGYGEGNPEKKIPAGTRSRL